MRTCIVTLALALAALAQSPAIALAHVRVIDGTGGPEQTDQTIVIAGGRITAYGPAATVATPAGAQVEDLGGDTVYPGLIGMHEHMFYPAGGNTYNEQAFSFPRLYLASGVTTIRTTGSVEPYADLGLMQAIGAGRMPGPEIFPTGPYLEGFPSIGPQLHSLKDAAEARQFVRYWASVGIDNWKAYMHITRAELAAAIATAHAMHQKITGHLCSIGFQEAAAMGMDDLEHGFAIDTEFVPGKQPDQCPNQAVTFATNANLSVSSPAVQATIHDLIARHVALTSTLPVFETFVPNRPPLQQRVLDVLSPNARVNYLRFRVGIAAGAARSPWPKLFPKEMEFERDFFNGGGLLLAGLDPTGGGGVVAGFGDQRELELLVEAGLTPEQAIQVYTLNGARYLGIADRAGTITAGKQADLVVVRGDPGQRIADVENVITVYKAGKPYDSAKLIAQVRGQVGMH